ncbi:MAG TPA: HEAT repeat domain-containing protein [Gemmatimonadaceae bacterium]|nr:HEAT repeat domain-containing protein [Gemmatimonadaceae bacterium]
MNAALILGVVGIVQVAFLALLLGFVLVRRRYDRERRAAFVAGREALAAPLRDWIVAGAHPEPVVRALRALPRGTAVGYVSLLARQTIPEAQRNELAVALRNEPWIRAAIARRDSRYWWRRLEAARALGIVGTLKDREAVLALLRDEHPAVQIAAATALPRVADEALFGAVMDGLFTMPKVTRTYLTGILRQRAATLAQRIRGGASGAELAAWIGLAAALDDPRSLEASLPHATHPAPFVRRTVARALGRYAGPEAARALADLVVDADATVRAAAARSLGELGATGAVPLLAPLIGDPVWQVRLHAALSLAQLGERGRAALRAAREGGDRFARDMATMVSGLSDGAILEMGQG